MTQPNARELLNLRAYLIDALTPDDVTRLGWRVVAKVAQPALDRGWAGRELGALAAMGVYDGTVDNPAAYIVANLRDLATINPPRETTPQPPPIAQVLAEQHTRHTPATDAATRQWLDRVRRTIHGNPA